MTLATRTWPFVLIALLTGCASAPISTRLPVSWEASPSFGARRVNLVVLHHTGSGSVEAALRNLRDPLAEVSAHYLVGRDGRLIQLVDERARAWHAGRARWGAVADVNSASIGIELDNNGDAPFPEPQIVALLRLLDDLRTRHQLGPLAFVAHGDVAPGRKVDPSARFPWRRLARHGFGLWCDTPVPPPAGFDPVLALQALGYDVRSPEAAAAAFNQRFGDGRGGGLSALDAGRLHCLVLKARDPGADELSTLSAGTGDR